MGKKQQHTFEHEINRRFAEIDRRGQSRHQAKIDGIAVSYVYSNGTWNTYRKCMHAFSKWIMKTYPKMPTLQQAQYVIPQYIWFLHTAGCSNFTVKTHMSALTKFYPKVTFSVIYAGINQKYCHLPDDQLPDRHGHTKTGTEKVKDLFMRRRDEITRSRYRDAGDATVRSAEKRTDAAAEKVREIIRFCEATGLRRNELEHMVPSFIHEEGGKVYIRLPSHAESREQQLPFAGTKNGKGRTIEILDKNQAFIRGYMGGSDRPIFGKVSHNIDIHARRAIYVNDLLDAFSRSLADLRDERCLVSNNRILLTYDRQKGKPLLPLQSSHAVQDLPAILTCKGGTGDSFAGRQYDRAALMRVAKSVGHNHYHTIISNYIR